MELVRNCEGSLKWSLIFLNKFTIKLKNITKFNKIVKKMTKKI